MLTEACRVTDVALGYFSVSMSFEQSDVNLAGMSTPGKIDNCLECLKLVIIICFTLE